MNKLQTMLAGLILLSGCSGSIPTLGVTDGRLAPCPASPNCVSSQASDAEHFIQPIRVIGTLGDIQNRLVRILESADRIKIVTIQDDYIRAEFKSALFRFVDDVEFLFREPNGTETIIDVRSASRVGHSDLGVNRKRIEKIRRQLGMTPDPVR
jgi:uncharacterized protein (DUF1499 family)